MHESRIVRVSRKLFRGPQPDREDLDRLARKGLRLVINLRQESYASRELAQEVGLEYLHLPVRDMSVPGLEQIDEMLRAIRETSPAFIHCHGGIGRTGVFVSCYRIARLGWSAESALERTEQEAYEQGLNSTQRQFVREYERELRERAEGGQE